MFRWSFSREIDVLDDMQNMSLAGVLGQNVAGRDQFASVIVRRV
jgi:hypothetical protein